ncbi:MAG: hypothetical protein ACHP84_13365 [Caulobacterales bacterium]
MKPLAALAPVAAACALALTAGPACAQQAPAGVVDAGTIGGYTGAASVLQTGEDLFTAQTSQTNYSAGLAVSGDGSTLVGTSGAPGGAAHAFMWTASGGIVDLGAFTATGRSVATGASGDGSIIVGFSDTSGGVWHAFRWTHATGMVDLGALSSGAGLYSGATAISADGSVIVGGSYTTNTIDRAFRWTQAGGMVNLGVIGGGSGFSDAYGVSGDGNVVVGFSTAPGGSEHAFRWTQAGGMADLGTIAGVPGFSGASGANADGSVVVGQSIDSTGAFRHAFRWTQAGGMADLGTIGSNAGGSAAYAVNGDGTIVVGSSVFGQGGAMHAFVWTNSSGVQDLNTVLAGDGVNMTGVSLTTAHGISTNGQFIAGSGSFPGAPGATHAFLARLAGSSSGVTTPASIEASIAALVNSRTNQMLNNDLLSEVLLALNEQISCGSCGGAYASFGSFEISTHGRYSLNKEWSVLGGMSYGRYQEQGADVTSSFTLAGALRFDPAGMGASRPFAEAGGTVSPSQQTTYSRHYANGAGVATGAGQTHSSNYSAYVRTGWVDRLSRTTEIAASVQATELWQVVDGYSEPSGSTNPFNAAVPGGTDRTTVVGVSGQVTHLFSRTIEGDINGGVAHSIGAQSGLNANVLGVGGVVAPPGDPTWFEAGGRLGVRLPRHAVLDLFVNSIIGGKQVGTSVHGGFGVRFDF